MKKYLCVFLALFTLTACNKKKTTPPPPNQGTDEYGLPIQFYDFLYERPGGVKIVFMHTYSGTHDFTEAEKGLLRRALDTLTNEEIINTGVHAFWPATRAPNSPLYVKRHATDPSVTFYFAQPTGSRPLDPNLGNELLKALGYGDRRVTSKSKVFDSDSGDFAWEEAIPLPSQRSVTPLPLVPMPGRVLPHNQFVVISPEQPDSYIPLTSRAGHDTLAMMRDPGRPLTPPEVAAKQLESHGVFVHVEP